MVNFAVPFITFSKNVSGRKPRSSRASFGAGVDSNPIESSSIGIGHLILLGGEILKAKRLKNGTQIELLQLPLTTDPKPTTDLTRSQGRVLVLHQELDSATLTPGTLVTFVGEVSGAIIEKMDEDDDRHPTLTVKHWHVWPPLTSHDRRGGPYFGVFGGTSVGGRSRGGGGFGIGF
jgi:outer membrane lipoprotein